MKYLPALLIMIGMLLLLGGGRTALGDTTLTPTPSPSPTSNNATLTGLETVAPPAACGSIYNPCQALPWSVPVFPTLALASPTTWPTYTAIPITATPTATLTPTPSPTGATITPTAPVDFSAVETLVDNFNQAAATMQDIGTADVLVSGTPASVAGLGGQLTTNVPGVFSTIKGVLATTNNRTMSVLGFLFICVLFVVLVQLNGLIFPVIMRLIEFVLMIIRTVKP